MKEPFFSFGTYKVGKPFHFLHIPKTAGSTFGFAITRLALDLRCNQISVKGSALIEKLHFDNLREQVAEVHKIHGQHFFSNAHLPLSYAIVAFGASNLITVLRDPVFRLFSDYCSQPNVPGQAPPDMHQFCQTCEDNFTIYPKPNYLHDNLHVRMLANSPRFNEACTRSMLEEAKSNLRERIFLWFEVDAIEEARIWLTKALGQQQNKPEKLNVTRNYRDQIEPMMIDWSKRYNEFDMELIDSLEDLQSSSRWKDVAISATVCKAPKQSWSIVDPANDSIQHILGPL